jgi:hypothetical protein
MSKRGYRVMLDSAIAPSCLPVPSASAAPGDEGDLAAFLGFLAACGQAPVVFAYGGREADAGLHVTEVKGGRFASLDCGANPESWSETFIQIWEAEGETGPLTAATFVKIMKKVAREAGLDPASRLTFEANSDAGVIGLYALERATLAAGRALVTLAPRSASCKPRDRWLAEHGRAGPADRRKCGSAPASAKSCCS